METLWWTTSFALSKQAHTEVFMEKSRDECHTYRHPLRGFRLMWYQPFRAFHQHSQSKELNHFDAVIHSCLQRLLRARVRGGPTVRVSDFMLLIIKRPKVSILLSEVWGKGTPTGGHCAGQSRAALRFSHPAVSSSQFQEASKSLQILLVVPPRAGEGGVLFCSQLQA